MTTLDSVWQPSVLDLARAGNFRAITYWINTYLLPQGIHAHVEDVKAGCLQILVESQQTPERERIVKSICHLIWRLNSEAIDGVRIAARLAGDTDILWKQSVRIVTPASQRRRRQTVRSSMATTRDINFKMLRTMLVVGVAVTSFVLSCWLTYQTTATSKTSATATMANAQIEAAPQQQRPREVRAALETVPVNYYHQVFDPADPIVTLMFSGDVNLAGNSGEGEKNTSPLAETEVFRGADLAMVNLETPLVSKTNDQSAATAQAVQLLVDGGVDLVNLPNQRTIKDSGADLQATLQTLDKAGLHYLGAGEDNKQSRRPEIVEVKGQRIAYLAYTDADLAAAAESQATTQGSEKNQIEEDIRALRNQVDWIVVNYHWQGQLSQTPSDQQKELAHFAIDNGADLVVGYHRDTLQGAEIYKGRPVAYSLSNFIFGAKGRSDYDTAVLKVSLKDRKMKVEFLPVQVRDHQPKVVKGEAGDSIIQNIEAISQGFDRPMTSPIILQTRRMKPSTPTPALPGANSVQLTTPGPVPASSGRPAVQLPVFPADIIRRNYLKDEELLQNGEQQVVPSSPKLEGVGEEQFIKQPFINNGGVPSPSSDDRHSQLPNRAFPSFTLGVAKREEWPNSLEVAGSDGHLKRVQLPMLA